MSVSSSSLSSAPKTIDLGKSTVTGRVPAFLDAIGSIDNNNKENPIVACFKFLNGENSNKKALDVKKIADGKRLAWVIYEKGLITSIAIHTDLLKNIDKKNVSEAALCCTDNSGYTLVKESFYFADLSDKIYTDLANKIKV